jgi:peptidoglycan/xylan/chitin deacetylase (PgdA/CDA1 family)
VVRAVADAGHEVNGHGWVNDVLPNPDDPDAERDEIRRCTQVLSEAAGVRPVGWTSPGSAGSDNTYRYLIEEGYLWNGDEAADDIPYLHETEAGTIAMLPRTNTLHNDLGMWIHGKNPPSIIWDGFKDTFDELYREGCEGYPKWTELTLHAHMAGRPTLIPTIRKCLRYAQDHHGVWFAPRRDIALWTQEREGVTLGSKTS